MENIFSDRMASSSPSEQIFPAQTPIPPRYEEEEEGDEDDDYAPQLPPDLAAARANAFGTKRRTLGPARGPLPREEEEEESEDEIGPAPPPLQADAGPSAAREDAITEFMQKEAQRRQAIEVRFVHTWFVHTRSCSCFTSDTRASMYSFPSTYFTGGGAP
jgi:hypothetical protein